MMGTDWTNFIKDLILHLSREAGIGPYGGEGVVPWKTTLEWVMRKYKCSYGTAYYRLKRAVNDSEQLSIEESNEKYWKNTNFKVYIRVWVSMKGW